MSARLRHATGPKMPGVAYGGGDGEVSAAGSTSSLSLRQETTKTKMSLFFIKIPAFAIFCTWISYSNYIFSSSPMAIEIKGDDKIRKSLNTPKGGNQTDDLHYSTDNPCSSLSTEEQLMGNAGDFGAMFVIAGSVDYARLFLPVVDYMRNSLDIPDAEERKQLQEEGQGNVQEMKYALVTEPHLCSTLREVIPFFDIIVTVAIKNDPAAIQEKATFLLPDFIQSTRELDTMKNKNKTVSFKSPYGQTQDLLYWAKLLKVTALSKISPFKTTLFVDADNIPCHANFGERILQKYKLEHGNEGEGFDIAAIPVNGAENYNPNQRGHWLDKAKWQESRSRPLDHRMGGQASPINLHNTRTVLLNVTSPRTRIFLDRYHYDYLYSYIDHANINLSQEQPSFGKAALSMSVEYGDKWKDVDLLSEDFCGWKVETSCRGNSCLAIHKMTLPC